MHIGEFFAVLSSNMHQYAQSSKKIHFSVDST